MAEALVLPERMVVTESWAPNAARAREVFGPRGVEVIETEPGAPLPLPDESFELVTSRHPVSPDWPEVARALMPGGTYFAQHVGPGSALELIEEFIEITAAQRGGRDPLREADDAARSGLEVVGLWTARCRMEFCDVGAIAYVLRKCVWVGSGLHRREVRGPSPCPGREDPGTGPFVAHSTRHLIEARRPHGSA